MEPFSDGLWPWILDEIDRTVSDVDASGRGRLLLLRGEPGVGLSRLLDDALSRLTQRRPRPTMIGGGFDVPGARGDFAALPMAGRARADGYLDGLGHAFSTASAAVAVADPSGVVKAAGAISALFGESAPGDAFLREGAPPPGVRFQDPNALVDTLRDRLNDGRMLFLVLCDIDRALPPVRWCDFFLLRSLPPLLQSSRLVVIATASAAGPLGVDGATDEDLDELVDAGIATTLAVGRYGAREVIASVGDADADLAEDLVALCGGDAERIAALFLRWTSDGIVARRDGRWTYASGREAARATAGDEVRAQLQGAFEHLDDAAAVKAYDIAVRTLRIAALEGMVFTVAALARALDVDENALSDWLDDYLVADDDRPDAPLEGLGFVEGASRPLYRYGFRSRLFWSVLHPEHGAASWHGSLPSRRVARRYADALAATYGPGSSEVVFRVWDLARLAGDDQGDYYATLVRATASARDYVRLLAAEEEVIGESRDSGRLVGSAQRIVKYLRPVAFTVPNEELLRYARLSQSLLDRAGDASADARVDVYSLLGLAASRGQGWVGDTARCEALSIELVGPENVHAFVERLTSLATVLLEIVHQDYDLIGTDWDKATGRHLDLNVPWIDELFVDRGTAREKVIAAAAGLLQDADRALDRIPAIQRHHLQAHLHHAIARLEHAQNDPAAAGRSENRALALLDEESESPCNLRLLALLGLADHLEATGDLQASADAARRGTRYAMSRADANEAARALATLGRLELALAEAAEACQHLAYSLVIGQDRVVPGAVADRWVLLGRCMVDLARTSEALECFALGTRTFGGDGSDLYQIATDAGLSATTDEIAEVLQRADTRVATSSALALLEEITGISGKETDEFLATFR